MIKPVEILRDAEQLASGITTEARRRTVLSRCYYASLHYLKSHPCAAEFHDRTDRSIHRSLVQYLAQSRDRTVLHCANLLIRLRNGREIADYSLGGTVTPAMAEESLEDASEIIEEALVGYRKN